MPISRTLHCRSRYRSHGSLKHTAARAKPGFTLIEILVVIIVVIAILASLVAPNVFRHVGTAKDATARAQIEMLGAALDAYREERFYFADGKGTAREASAVGASQSYDAFLTSPHSP